MANIALDTAAYGLSGQVYVGDGRTFTATDSTGNGWPATTRLHIESAAGVDTVFTPAITGTASELATWALTIAEVAALIGTKTSGSLRARLTTGTGDLLRPDHAGAISILSKYAGIRSAQSLGTVTLGPPGPGVSSAAIVDGALVLTLDNSETLDPVSLPLTAVLAEDGTTPGLYHMGVGTTYALTLNDDDLYNMTPLTTTLGVI